MSRTVIVRYRTRPEAAEENAHLVEAVYSALAELAPPEFRYATYGSRTASPSSTSPISRAPTTRCRHCPHSPNSPEINASAASSRRRRAMPPSSARAGERHALLRGKLAHRGGPEQVWPVLTDVAAWPDWDSGVTRVDGRLALGEKLAITVAANPGRVFPVKVVQLDAPRRMVFRGGMPLGLFTGERAYTLVAEGAGTRFEMREQYTGPLAGMIFRSIPDLGPSFRQFAEGLGRRAVSS